MNILLVLYWNGIESNCVMPGSDFSERRERTKKEMRRIRKEGKAQLKKISKGKETEEERAYREAMLKSFKGE